MPEQNDHTLGLEHARAWAEEIAQEIKEPNYVSESDWIFLEEKIKQKENLAQIFIIVKAIAEKYSNISIINNGVVFSINQEDSQMHFEFLFKPQENPESLAVRINDRIRGLLQNSYPDDQSDTNAAISNCISSVQLEINLNEEHKITNVATTLIGATTVSRSLEGTIIWDVLHEESVDVDEQVEEELEAALESIDYVQELKSDGYLLYDASGFGDMPSARSVFLLYQKEHDRELAIRLQRVIDRILQ